MSAKTRKVYFRLTKDEYRAMEQASAKHGIKCISELVRIAVANFLGIEEQPKSPADQLARLKVRFALLAGDAEFLAQRIAQSAAAASAVPPSGRVINFRSAVGDIDTRRACLPRRMRSKAV